MIEVLAPTRTSQISWQFYNVEKIKSEAALYVVFWNIFDIWSSVAALMDELYGRKLPLIMRAQPRIFVQEHEVSAPSCIVRSLVATMSTIEHPGVQHL